MTPEQIVVASVLLDSRVLDSVTEVVQPADFADERLRDMLGGMIRMRSLGEPVDVISVGYKLAEWGIKGVSPADLHVWVGEVPTAASAPFYAREVVADALRRGLARVSARMLQEGERDPAGAARAAREALEGLQRRAAADDAEVLTVSDLLGVDVSHDWLVSGLLEKKDRLMLTGAEGLGKSTFLRQIVFCTAAGVHPFRDWQTMPARRVLVVDTENTARQWARATRDFVKRLGLAPDSPVEGNLRVAPVRRLDVTAAQDLAMLHQLVDEHDPELVMIGPLYRLSPRAIMSDDDAAPLLAALDTLRDRDVALVIEAHAGKATSDKGERNLAPRGSSALLGWPEFGLGLRPVKGKPNEIELIRWRGDREERMWPRKLKKSTDGLPFQELVQA